jgi:pheromone a factor receptor
MVKAVGLSDLYPYNIILYSLSILAVLIPAPAHFKSGNPGVILLACWILASQTILLADAIIWRGNISDNIPYYCDFTTAVIAVAPVGYSASVLCITRQLHKLSRAQAVIISKSQKRKSLLIDLCIGLGIPILAAGGHGIVQGHRYSIYEDWGCYPTTYNVTLAFPLYYIWPLVLSLISAVYGMLALRQFLKRRKSFEMLLSSNGSGMQKNRYLRLMWLCCCDLLIAVPYHIFTVVDLATNQPVDPWVSWAVTQADWYRVDYFQRILLDQVPYVHLLFTLVMVMTCILAFLFFALFGFTRETNKWYRNAYYWCMRPLGVKKPQRALHLVSTQAAKRTWLDKLLRREAIPLNSVSNTTGSIPAFASTQQMQQQSRSIPSARGKTTTMTTSTTDTLDWEDGSRVMVIDGRLSIPGLRNGMASFESSSFEDEKDKFPRTPSTIGDHNKPFHSVV